MTWSSSVRSVGAPRLAAALVLTVAAFLVLASGARASTLLYWNNYDANTLSFSSLDGSGGGSLNLTGATLAGPEGMALDPVSGRLFVASTGGAEGKGQILAVKLDGSGASVFTAPGAVFEGVEGAAVDPVTRMLFWSNTEGGAGGNGSIGWAKLDGSAGGVLNTTGAVVEDPYKLVVDPGAGRVYWSNNVNTANDSIAYANVNNTGGGGSVNMSGATPPAFISGLALDPAAGRIYWAEEDTGEGFSYANLSGSGAADLPETGASLNQPYGLAMDPSNGTLYWANYNNKLETEGAFGTLGVSSGIGGGINIASAPVSGPQDPQILKSPAGTGAPKLTRSKKSRSKLECSTGSWAAGNPGGFVYQEGAYSYRWSKNGKAVGGATAASLNVKSAGKYSCTVTAANQAGSAAQTSLTLNIEKASLKLTTRAKASAKPGATATFKVKAANTGDLKSGNAKVCVKLSSAAKQALKAPGCKSLGKLAGGKKKTAKLKLTVLPSASAGTYKLTFQPKGAKGKAAKAEVVVAG
jgi:hypothetical protein